MDFKTMAARKITPAPVAVLITGAAGFIGFHLARRYLRAGVRVVGADNPADFGDADIRRRRMELLLGDGLDMREGDLSRQDFVERLFVPRPDAVFHLAARAGARCRDAGKFSKDNIEAFVNVLAAARARPPAHFLFASSSAVYGDGAPRPFCENHPIAPTGRPYADSKWLNENIARFWARAEEFPVTGIRFFNVYGPWGREDMALFRFADCLARGRHVPVITGDAMRSWLYVEDAVSTCIALAQRPPDNQYRAVNVAGPRLVRTLDALEIVARKMGKRPRIVQTPPECPETMSNPADLTFLESLTGGVPRTDFEDGIDKFLEWHGQYLRESEQRLACGQHGD